MRNKGKRIITVLLCTILLVTNFIYVNAAPYPNIMLNGIPYFPQKISGDCGISSISMIEAYGLGYDATYYDALYEGVFEANGNSLSIGTAVSSGRYTDITKDVTSIYNELKKGNPVLVYRTGSNKEHWSVIVGYSGSTTSLEESGFIVYNTARGATVGVPYTDTLSNWLSGTTWKYAKVRSTGALSGVTTSVSNLTLENVRYPNNLKKGSGMGSTGLLISNGSIISVEVGVKTTGGTVCFNASSAPNARYYGLMNFDSSMKFSSLSSGTYIYYVYASDSTGATLQWEKQFTVSSSATSLSKTSVVSSSNVESQIIMNSSKFTNLYVDQLTDTSVKIGTEYAQDTFDDLGFYFGTVNDINQMTKVSENKYGTLTLPTVSYGNSYKLGVQYDGYGYKWWEPLTAGTTYYWAFYLKQGNTEHISTINSFTTTGDLKQPTIESATITDLSSEGYTIEIVATDNVGIERVTCPSWHIGDDTIDDWYNNAVATKVAENTYTYRVNIANHNNERGEYATHVYAYDMAGNYTIVEMYPINVPEPTVSVAGVTLNASSLSLEEGETKTLIATISPSNATYKEMTWQTSDINVVNVANGVVTAVAPGTAIITVITADGGYNATCTVTVKEGVIDENAPKLVVSDAQGMPGDTVTVPVRLENNPGFAALNFYLTYSNDLTLIETVNSVSELTLLQDKANMVFYGFSDYSQDGELLNLTFSISEDAVGGDYFVRANFVDASTEDEEDVVFTTIDGYVAVVDYIYGDSNSDQIVNTKDIIRICRYIAAKDPATGVSSIEISPGADANGDGVINTKDIIRVCRYIAAKDPMTGESSVVLGPSK